MDEPKRKCDGLFGFFAPNASPRKHLVPKPPKQDPSRKWARPMLPRRARSLEVTNYGLVSDLATLP